MSSLASDNPAGAREDTQPPVAGSVAEGTEAHVLYARREVERIGREAENLNARLAEARARLARVEAWAAAQGNSGTAKGD